MVQLRRTRRTRPDLQVLHASLEEELLTGLPFFVGDGASFRNLEDFRAAWEIHRDRLRAEWRNSRGPGRRCFAEWLLELIPQYGPRRTTRAYAEHCQQYEPPRLLWNILHTNTVPPWQEPERDYLDRHGLLDGKEREALREWDEMQADFEQEHNLAPVPTRFTTAEFPKPADRASAL